MAFHEIERGVRELIRMILRESGIKHRSTDSQITTICYAVQPLVSVEFYGPITFGYDGGIVTASVYGTKDSTKYTEYSITPSQLMDKRPIIPPPTCVHSEKFDVANPSFETQVKKLLNRFIPDKIKKPLADRWCVRSEYAFVPSVWIRKDEIVYTRWQRIKRWICKKLGAEFRPDQEIDAYYWKHAIRRYFGVSETEAQIIVDTAAVLKMANQSEKTIEEETNKISQT